MLATVATVAAGLGTRHLAFLAFLGKYPGDALWALMVFFIVAFVRPRASTLRVGMIALGISWVVEVSQLYEPPWLVSIRATTLGHLVLGAKFHVTDLVAYLAGVALGAGIDHARKVLLRPGRRAVE